MRFTAVAVIVVLAAFACAAIAQPPPGPAPGPPGPGPGRQMGPALSPEQMIEQYGARIGLTEAEKAATKQAVAAKLQAAQALGGELRALGQVARNENPTDQELRSALQKFDAARTDYYHKIRAIDAQLIKAISLKAQARLTALGVIDNGLGQRLGQRRGQGMGGQGGGARRRMAPAPPGPGEGQ